MSSHRYRQALAGGSSSSGASQDIGSGYRAPNGFRWDVPPFSAGRIGASRCIISANGKQKIFRTFADANGELTLTYQPTVCIESPQFERLLYLSTDRVQMINGWAGRHGYDVCSYPENNNTHRVRHLNYSVSAGGQVYVVKTAHMQAWSPWESRTISYPYSFSNLVAMTLRHHQITGHTLRHIIFDRVVSNPQAWGCVLRALSVTRLSLPSHPEPTITKETTVPELCVRTNPIDHGRACHTLQNNNPLAKMLRHLILDERVDGIRCVEAYTIVVVPQASWGQYAPQEYWCALIAHF